ncbi:unnamed protein product, partial [Notodromas monacha]
AEKSTLSPSDPDEQVFLDTQENIPVSYRLSRADYRNHSHTRRGIVFSGGVPVEAIDDDVTTSPRQPSKRLHQCMFCNSTRDCDAGGIAEGVCREPDAFSCITLFLDRKAFNRVQASMNWGRRIIEKSDDDDEHSREPFAEKSTLSPSDPDEQVFLDTQENIPVSYRLSRADYRNHSHTRRGIVFSGGVPVEAIDDDVTTSPRQPSKRLHQCMFCNSTRDCDAGGIAEGVCREPDAFSCITLFLDRKAFNRVQASMNWGRRIIEKSDDDDEHSREPYVSMPTNIVGKHCHSRQVTGPVCGPFSERSFPLASFACWCPFDRCNRETCLIQDVCNKLGDPDGAVAGCKPVGLLIIVTTCGMTMIFFRISLIFSIV